MTKTIKIKGIGSVTQAPDYVVLKMEMDTQSETYAQTLQIAENRINQINLSLAQIDFEKNACKTTYFNINTNYKTVYDKYNNRKEVFAGFTCFHHFEIGFDYTSERLGQVLDTLASCNAEPKLSIHFTVKDPTAISERLLRSATSNAFEKARILCDASGVQLGDLLSIDYRWSDIDVYSDTEICTAKMSLPISPNDIEVSDTATFVWEIKS